MNELLKNFTLEQIVLFIVLSAAAIKGVVSWIDWLKGRIDKKVSKKEEEKSLNDKIDNIIKVQMEQTKVIQKNTDMINLLIASDKDDIKAWITEKHHYFCYNLKCIDDYNLDCIEKRYNHYQKEDGNSFVGSLMEEIRSLPKTNDIRGKIEKLDK